MTTLTLENTCARKDWHWTLGAGPAEEAAVISPGPAPAPVTARLVTTVPAVRATAAFLPGPDLDHTDL
jgi:hypothetical protein